MAAIPSAVLGGAALVLFATVAVIGIQTLSRVDFHDERNVVIVAVSLGLALVPVGFPTFYRNVPADLQIIVGSGITMGSIAAIALNLVFNILGGKRNLVNEVDPTPRTTEKVTLDQVNDMQREDFVAKFGPLFQGPPVDRRGGVGAAALRERVRPAPRVPERDVRLPAGAPARAVRSYPDLAGRPRPSAPSAPSRCATRRSPACTGCPRTSTTSSGASPRSTASASTSRSSCACATTRRRRSYRTSRRGSATRRRRSGPRRSWRSRRSPTCGSRPRGGARGGPGGRARARLNELLGAEEAGRLDRESFVARFGELYEHSPWVAEAAWERRPFATRAELERAFDHAVAEAGEAPQLALIRAHPDLAGRAAREGTLTSASTGEQASAGLDALSPEELGRLDELNDAYRERFGFPYVVAAREHTKDSILADLAARLGNDPDAERRTALGEIGKIARLRLDRLVAAPDHDTDQGG